MQLHRQPYLRRAVTLSALTALALVALGPLGFG